MKLKSQEDLDFVYSALIQRIKRSIRNRGNKTIEQFSTKYNISMHTVQVLMYDKKSNVSIANALECTNNLGIKIYLNGDPLNTLERKDIERKLSALMQAKLNTMRGTAKNIAQKLSIKPQDISAIYNMFEGYYTYEYTYKNYRLKKLLQLAIKIGCDLNVTIGSRV
jgi:hypothetical protein